LSIPNFAMTRLASLESLRGAAALMVLFAHVKFPVMDACGTGAVPSILRPMWGACGVDLFFVISGFVIGLTIDRSGMTWRAFLAARVARVVPMYALFSLVCLVVSGVVCFRLSPNVVANSFLFLPLFDTNQFSGTLHPYGWTLSFEIMFYLTAAATLAVAGAARAPIWLAVIFGTCPFVLLYSGYDDSWYFPRFAFSPMVMEFSLGCLAHRLTCRHSSLGLGVTALLAGVALLALGSFRADRLATYLGVLGDVRLASERVAVWGLPSFLIVGGAAAIERRNGWWPGERVAFFLGSISFSLYLVQPIALFVVGSVFLRLGWSEPWIVVVAAVALAVGAARITNRVAEQPLVTGTRKRLERWLGVSKPCPRLA
jgi:exopolysaccharide production protein ExoZ